MQRLEIGGVHFRSRHVRNWHNAAYQSAKFFFCNNTEANRDGLKRHVFTYLPAGAEIILWDVTPCRLSKTTRRHNSTLKLGQNFFLIKILHRKVGTRLPDHRMSQHSPMNSHRREHSCMRQDKLSYQNSNSQLLITNHYIPTVTKITAVNPS